MHSNAKKTTLQLNEINYPNEILGKLTTPHTKNVKHATLYLMMSFHNVRAESVKKDVGTANVHINTEESLLNL